ncbi:SDR family NAD(P)-dependent oxidoreductase, partial [Roseobacter sp.]|uniref:SDR family oxidoreductase n=1 Tax=Roseobacter sp. TaxID=1907202 RepID=UPI003298EA9F
MHLQGKHALVTGGGTGIGLAIARALAEDGAHVTITGRRAEVLQDVATDRLHPLVMDVRDESSIVQGVADAVAARGPIQICIANAGVAEGRALHNTDTEFWDNMIAT